jgi:uncharacterized protein (TIGR02145 family)
MRAQLIVYFASIILTVFVACDPDETPNSSTPTILTALISNIGQDSATCGGYVSTDGGFIITARGVCWDTAQTPMITDNKTVDGSDTGSFVSSIRGLFPGTKYYVRAYASNKMGTAYGNEINFTTNSDLTVSTKLVTNIGLDSATCGGHVLADGGVFVTARGVCWNTSPTPTIANFKTVDGLDTGSFVSSIRGLSPGKTYYARAYATNNLGTAYGTEINFTTDSAFVDPRDGRVYSAARIGSLIWMAQNLNYYTPSGSWYYNYDSISYSSQYGRLYDWTTAISAAPTGWHLPSKTEYDSLLSYLGGPGNASYLQMIPTGNSGFKALFAGFRYVDGAYFSDLGAGALFWSATSYDTDGAWFCYVYDGTNPIPGTSNIAGMNFNYQAIGASVRYVKN